MEGSHRGAVVALVVVLVAMGGSHRGAVVAAAVLLVSIGLRPVIVKIRRRGHMPRVGTLEIISEPENAKFEIIAVHGLGADPDHTWSHSAPRDLVDRNQESDHAHQTRIHLLRDLLCKDFPDARILSFAHNSRWITDAPIKTTEEIGKSLLKEVQARRSSRGLPIVFLGHSLGGIVIKQALCGPDSNAIVNDTSGIIFLGTPHQGSPVSVTGAIVAFTVGFLGSDPTLLLSLRDHESQLSNLQSNFDMIIKKRQKDGTLSIWSFYETKPTYLLNWLSLGRVVSRPSAVVHADEQVAIDTDHSGLNKCAGPNDPLYKKLRDTIIELRAPSLLEQADTYLRDEHYAVSRLKIVRLSGRELLVDQCYINLAIVEKRTTNHNDQKKQMSTNSIQSILARQRVETPPEAVQVALSAIFNQREAIDGRLSEPRRILIRGRAGVGKTTLCKKIVYDFTRKVKTALNCSWGKVFDRVLWVPLRNLKDLPETAYNFEGLFYHEYFSPCGPDRGHSLASSLQKELEHTDSDRTLFILDGLDEISHELARGDYMARFLKSVLAQPNVIITSRPNASVPASIKDVDLELETIGFYPRQVKAYLETDPQIKQSAHDIQIFLRSHWLMEGLMRLPIQLDALCYTWEDFRGAPVPDTMTRIYSAIETKLWKKDVVRLKKMSEGSAANAFAAEIKHKNRAERNLLECLAFNGLYSNVLEFTPAHREKLVNQFPLSLTLDDTFDNLSFLRASNSSRHGSRSYHFIHLTFQEYFAARYFVRHWHDHKPLEYIFMTPQASHSFPLSDPTKFLQGHKYSARYDVFWRFVAGLLGSEHRINDFFDQIEQPPLDLLGPTHQRLIMHCLSEVSRETDLPRRTELENGLRRWLQFEYEVNKSLNLAKEIEFPVRAIDEAFHEGSDKMRHDIFKAFLGRADVPLCLLEHGYRYLGSEKSELRASAFRFLVDQKTLPKEITSSIAAQLKSESLRIRRAAGECLINLTSIPEDILNGIAALLKSENLDIRDAAVDFLGRRAALPAGILDSIAPLLKSEDLGIRGAAVKVLASQTAHPSEIHKVLSSFLNHHDWKLQMTAIRVSITHGMLSNEFFDRIAKFRGDEEQTVRQDAVENLQWNRPNLFPDETLRVVAARLNDESGFVRYTALIALSGQPALPDEILQTIAAMLDEHD